MSDRYTLLAANSQEVLRVTPDGKVWLRDGEDLIDLGFSMPVPLPEPSDNYAYMVMHEMGKQLAAARAAMLALGESRSDLVRELAQQRIKHRDICYDQMISCGGYEGHNDACRQCGDAIEEVK